MPIIDRFNLARSLLHENGGDRDDSDCNPIMATVLEMMDRIVDEIAASPEATRVLNDLPIPGTGGQKRATQYNPGDPS
ncbi:MAG: hypothetical protein KDJ44_16580 [Rhodoblastus sp.]|nr:hypothetical protein [Rhodoblastus sp.]